MLTSMMGSESHRPDDDKDSGLFSQMEKFNMSGRPCFLETVFNHKLPVC